MVNAAKNGNSLETQKKGHHWFNCKVFIIMRFRPTEE